jgi:hypothetical protein
MPDAPYLPLTGGGTARMSLKAFLQELENDYQNQSGHFFEYVWESDRDEADTYALETWEVCTPESGIYEAIVILYYSPINVYLTLKKHMGEDGVFCINPRKGGLRVLRLRGGKFRQVTVNTSAGRLKFCPIV